MPKTHIISREQILDHELAVRLAQTGDGENLLNLLLDGLNTVVSGVMTEAEARRATAVQSVDPRLVIRFEMTAEILTPLERAVRAAEERARAQRELSDSLDLSQQFPGATVDEAARYFETGKLDDPEA